MNLVEENLTQEELQELRNKRAGMFFFQVSWIMAFVCMVVVNWQLRFSPNWNAPDLNSIDFILPTMATAALSLSVYLITRAVDALKVGATETYRTQWLATIILGAFFVLVMLYEWFAVATGTQYAQVFRLMTGFHMFHAIVIGIYMLGVYANRRSSENYWAVEAGARLWYFVLIAWLLFYAVIYLI
jgi:heme/copper-type cytochrome/quinol oxidase subunit 3